MSYSLLEHGHVAAAQVLACHGAFSLFVKILEKQNFNLLQRVKIKPASVAMSINLLNGSPRLI